LINKKASKEIKDQKTKARAVAENQKNDSINDQNKMYKSPKQKKSRAPFIKALT
jgi:hypothetical protein